MSERIDKLKAEHPELCFICGCAQPAPFPLPEHNCKPHPVIAALVAALGEVGEELRQEAASAVKWADRASTLAGEVDSLRAQLAAARKDLEEADRALIEAMNPAYPGVLMREQWPTYEAALRRQAQRQGGEVK